MEPVRRSFSGWKDADGGRKKTGITADTALRLSRYVGTTPSFWMSLRANYDLEIARDSQGAEIIDRIRPRQAA